MKIIFINHPTFFFLSLSSELNDYIAIPIESDSMGSESLENYSDAVVDIVQNLVKESCFPWVTCLCTVNFDLDYGQSLYTTFANISLLTSF